MKFEEPILRNIKLLKKDEEISHPRIVEHIYDIKSFDSEQSVLALVKLADVFGSEYKSNLEQPDMIPFEKWSKNAKVVNEGFMTMDFNAIKLKICNLHSLYY